MKRTMGIFLLSTIIIYSILMFNHYSIAQQSTSPILFGPVVSRPTCTVETRGWIYTSWGDAGSNDGVEICSKLSNDTYAWDNIRQPTGGANLPSGSIILKNSGTCPIGFSEVSALDGKTLFGTLNSHADVGSTGGNDNITPTGTNSGGAVADHDAHTHTYSQVVNHVHGVSTILRTATTGSATTQVTNAADTSSTADTTRKTDNPDSGVSQGTTDNPSVTLTHNVTQPTFIGTQFDNRSAFMKVIFCSKD